MREVGLMAGKAKTDEMSIDELIAKNEIFILRCASYAARNYVSKNDNEWFVALGAFSKAVTEYSPDKGNFLNFAELSMRRSVSEFIRSQSRYADENLIDVALLDLELDGDFDCIPVKSSISQGVIEETESYLKLEIELANDVLSSYGFTFFDLASCSPKSRRDKRACVRVVEYMMKNPILVSNMKVKKSLQKNIIEKNAKVSRRLIEHYQKYIITAVEIISGDYRCLSEYIRFIREGLKDESCSC